MATHKSNDAEQHPQSTVGDMIVQDDIRNGDEALNFLRKEEIGDELEYVDEKQLLRKIDFMILPLCFMCYLLEYLDKSLCKYLLFTSQLQLTKQSSKLRFSNGPPNGRQPRHKPIRQPIVVVLRRLSRF